MAFDTLSFPPAAHPLALRNAALDWAIHDISNLSSAEIGLLSAETSLNGALLVVHPNEARAGVALDKFEGFEAFRASPGRMLHHFALAGVGSSDLGAASLARTLANHLGEPVGAIVAGYGAADLVGEAMGGWFFFGGANRLLAPAEPPTVAQAQAALAMAEPGSGVRGAWDAVTLLRLLREPEREIRTLLGHAKGGLTLSFALQALELAEPATLARHLSARMVTAGAVQPMPAALAHVEQYLGALDWFGELNSDPTMRRTLAPRAWHHLNTQTPAHLDLAAALSGALD